MLIPAANGVPVRASVPAAVVRPISAGGSNGMAHGVVVHAEVDAKNAASTPIMMLRPGRAARGGLEAVQERRDSSLVLGGTPNPRRPGAAAAADAQGSSHFPPF